MFCSTTVPPSPNRTEQAIHNAKLKSKETDWNAFNKTVEYKCPVGYVLERPNNDTEQITKVNEFTVRCDADAWWRPVLPENPFPKLPIMPTCIRKLAYAVFYTYFDCLNISAINCTEPPFEVPNNALGAMNWTEVKGNPRPYSTVIKYTCPVREWGYPENGFNTTIVTCTSEGLWNLTNISSCISTFCNVKP